MGLVEDGSGFRVGQLLLTVSMVCITVKTLSTKVLEIRKNLILVRGTVGSRLNATIRLLTINLNIIRRLARFT